MLANIEITNFSAGELSPRLKGRTDYQRYYQGCDTALNLVILPQGGATRRPGTLLAAVAKDQAGAPGTTRLIPFIFSTVQAYQLEFSNANARVYMDDGVVLNGGVPVDVTVPYTSAELPSVGYTQSADTLFLLHQNHPPASLSRSSHVNWTYGALSFRDGPYLSLNTTDTTLSPSGTSGSITIAASAIVGINTTPTNSGQGFLATDVGRLIRIKLLSLWAWCIITAVTDTMHVTATVQPVVPNGADGLIDGAPWTPTTNVLTGAIRTNGGNLYQVTVGGQTAGSGGPSGTATLIVDGSVQWQFLSAGTLPTATTQWQLGKWSTTTGWPQLPTFWQSRFACLGSINQPSAVDCSVSGDFTNFAPTQADGTVTDVNALSWVISDDQVNAVRWVSPAGSAIAMQLGIGTAGAEQIMQPATNSLALSSTNVQVYRETQIGGAENVKALRIGKSVLFANKNGRKLMDWLWQWAINGYVAFDRTVDSEHITRPDPSDLQGIMEMTWQQQPYGVVWARLGDGNLVGFTYLQEQNVYAWHRHQLGGNYYGMPPFVESVSVIPSPDGSYDELWLSVVRTVAGVYTRTIEVMTRYFDGAPTEQAVFSDCGLQSALNLIGTATLFPSAASGSGVTFTTSVPDFDGTILNPSHFLRLNGGLVLVKQLVNNHTVIGDYWRPADNNSIKPAPPNAWSADPQNATWHGLEHLNGETVIVLGDGADMGTSVVAGGEITLAGGATASFVTAGLAYESKLVGMPFNPERAAISAVGKVKRIDHLYLRLHESLGCNFGIRKIDPVTALIEEMVEPLDTRSGADAVGQAPALFSGIRRLPSPGGYDFEAQVEINTSSPFPLTVLAFAAKADVGEASQ